MSEDILKNLFNIKKETHIEFKKLYGLTFVFKTEITYLNKHLSSAEIKPQAIIWMENNDYYFTPLDENTDTEEIVGEFVKAEECFASPP